nr:cysteine-rich secretory protein 1-like [Peromyscus maniculatus bairdii]
MDLITSPIPSVLLRTPCTKHLNADLFSLLCFLDMALFPLLLFLAAVLPPSILREHYENMKFEDLTTTRVSVQEEIVNKHNQLRRMVSPPGSDLLKMVRAHNRTVNLESYVWSFGNFLRRQYIPYTIGQPCALCPDHCEDGLCTNSCEYEDKFSNCAELKASLTCDYPMVKQECKATCNCEGKIH